MGDYNNALECFLKSYNYHKEEKDNNYQCITSSLSNIAAALAYLERKDEALIYIKKAVEIVEQSSEKDIKVLATMYLNAGVQYGELGFFQTARKYHILSLRLLKKFYKIEHLAIADAMCNLGINHSDLGNFNKSLKYLFKGLEMFKMFFEDNHPKIPNFLHNIGAVYSKFNKPIDAVSYFEKALKICRLTLGDRHPKSIVSAASLVDQLVKLGKTEEAGRLSLEYLSYIPQNHPAKHVFESHSKFYKKRKKRHKKY